MVVIVPAVMPKVSCKTLATGARQLVVQEALEMTLCLAGSWGRRFWCGNFVPPHKLNVFVVERRAHDVASDATETVNADPNGHSSSAGMVTRCGAVFRTEFRPCCELEML